MFQKATKKKSKARVALIGPSGSGKTYTALTLARALGNKIAVIDTERGSASKYSRDVAEFDVCELPDFSPKRYIDALHFAAREGYDVIVIDSLTHAWTGEGGILDQKDKKGGNSFDTWRTLTPQHNGLVEAILGYPGHVIATMRVKTEYIVEKDDRGKSVPRKIGLAPVQRDGLEYEFDVVADMDPDNCMHVSKSRCPALNGASIRKPGSQVAESLLAWLDDGEAVAPAPAPSAVAPLRSVGKPVSLGDINDEEELRAYGERNRAAFSAKPKEWREKATAAVTLAAGRCGVSEAEALKWCGLAEGVA